MTTAFVNFGFPATGGTASRTIPDRLADIINIKDYGAKGDGVTSDGAAIQAAFDAAYGPASAPHGSNFRLNKGVFFPGGKYLIDQQLFLNDVQGAWLFGAGQHATQLIYTGPASKLPSGDLTSLLTCRTVTYSRFEGITFDATSSNATVCVQLMNWASLSNDGTGNTWINCAFIGGSSDGFLCTLDGSGQLGSEELFTGCTFDGCTNGLLINSGNGLNYTLIKCTFRNGTRGIQCPVGAVNAIVGCNFHNNNQLDIWVKQDQAPTIIGCYSDSPNFCLAGPVWIVGCYHNPSSAGGIWNALADNQDEPKAIVEGCYLGGNSGIYGNNTHTIYLRSNTVLNAGYLSNFSGTVAENI